MSSDAIINGLKQGNAIEMELVKKMKEGLDFIADGMLKECYTRSDALSELREELQAARSAHNDALKELKELKEKMQFQRPRPGLGTRMVQDSMEQKSNLKREIEDAIRKCQASKSSEDDRLHRQNCEREESLEDLRVYNAAMERNAEQTLQIYRLRKFVNDLYTLPLERVRYELAVESSKVQSLWVEESKNLTLEGSRVYSRVAKRRCRVRELKAETRAAREQIATLKRIADAAGIRLDDA